MSVTFTAEIGDIVGYRATCVCGESGPLAASWEEARDSDVDVPCTDPAECSLLYGIYVEAVEARPSPAINASNVNARAILGTLGVLEEDLCGSMDADDFAGRVLLARALVADAGVAPTVHLGGRYVDCGRAPGYLDERLMQLAELAEFAVGTGRNVVWS